MTEPAGEPGNARVAYQVTYRGSVQGVGFRFTVVHLAKNHPEVTGYVRNLADGDVELVVEGTMSEVESLLDDVAAEPLARYIRNVTAVPLVATGRFNGFTIRY